MQIKTTIRSHLTPVKMVVINKSTNNKCTQQCGESGQSYMLMGLLIVAATVESSVEFPQKSKNGTDSWPSNSISGNLPKRTRNTDSKEYMKPETHGIVICNSQDMKTAQMPITTWVNNKTVVHLHSRKVLLGHYKKKKKERKRKRGVYLLQQHGWTWSKLC